MEQPRIVFGLVGSGWRAECFLRVATLCPERFQVCGLVTRCEQKQEELRVAWKIPVYRSSDELLAQSSPDFLVTAVAKDAGAGVIKDLTAKHVPVLAETPPAISLEDLIELYQAVGADAGVQIAEQYHLQPMHAARLALIESGILGETRYAQVSISHGYHGISLIRKMLGIGFENAIIQSHGYEFPAIEGPGRQGPPEHERIVTNQHVIGLLDFAGKVGMFDFEKNQHRSWIRSQRVLVRGSRGEVSNTFVKYLHDFKTPITFELQRQQAGECENLEGYYLKGIIGGEAWLYTNPFAPARLSDEEIAIATCLLKMYAYVKEGISFYSLAEAAQDQYLALMMDAALRQDEPIKTETQCWAV